MPWSSASPGPVARRRTRCAVRGVEVVAYDASTDVDGAGLDAERPARSLGRRVLDGVGLLVKSPGVPNEAEPIVAARARGVPVVSEIELGARLLPNPFVAVTGTNGKTTTTALLGADPRGGRGPGRGGRATSAARSRHSSGTSRPTPGSCCELSSFQLEDVTTLAPRVAVLTNLEPDHLDRHGTFDAYAAIKLSMFERQRQDDVAVVPRGFGPVPGDARRVEFAADDTLPAEPRIRGEHNRENAAAATAAARAIGVAGRGDRATRSSRSPVSSTASRRSRSSTASST